MQLLLQFLWQWSHTQTCTKPPTNSCIANGSPYWSLQALRSLQWPIKWQTAATVCLDEKQSWDYFCSLSDKELPSSWPHRPRHGGWYLAERRAWVLAGSCVIIFRRNLLLASSLIFQTEHTIQKQIVFFSSSSLKAHKLLWHCCFTVHRGPHESAIQPGIYWPSCSGRHV